FLITKRMDGRCEVECLSFEDKIGGCRAELTPLCCKKRKNN
ncbi:beta-defensin 107A-like, partial [Canis aureus]